MDEKKLNIICYKVTRWPKILFYGAFFLSMILTPFMLRDGFIHLSIIATIGGICCLVVAIKLNFIKIVIKDNRIIKVSKYPTRSYEIAFNEIGIISDDDISTFPFKLHVYHLIPKDGIKKNFTRFTIHEGIEHRDNLLSEIVSRVDKDTEIDRPILNLVEEYRRKQKDE